jgi:adenosylcobinamide-phosphate synthase
VVLKIVLSGVQQQVFCEIFIGFCTLIESHGNRIRPRYDGCMSFFAILFALLIEQAKPLARRNGVHMGMRAWVRTVERNLDTGQRHHGWLTWAAAVVIPVAISLMVYAVLAQVSLILAFIWTTAVLYVTLGFRQFSHNFTAIRQAFEGDDEQGARMLLAQWKQVAVNDLPENELMRQFIEHSVLAAHRHVFGVLCSFALLAALGLGPAGAVLYRMAEFVQRYWQYKAQQAKDHAADPLTQPHAMHTVSGSLLTFTQTVWYTIDYIPARATAVGFVVVGSFEDAIECWRNHAQAFPDDNDGLVLAATAGAVNIRLGSEASPGREPDIAYLPQIVGLVWRSVVLWLLLIALLTLAHLLG